MAGAEKGNGQKSTICIVVTVVLLLAIGIGVGVGVGVSMANKKSSSPESSAPAPVVVVPRAANNSAVANLTAVKDKLLEWVPLDLQRTDTVELAGRYYEQVYRTLPVADVLASLLPIIGVNSTFNSTVVQPQAIQMLLQGWLEDYKVDGGSLASTLSNLAQLLQGLPDYQAKLLTLTRNFANVTRLVKGQLDQVLNSTTALTGRHLMQSDLLRTIRIAVDAALASPAAAPFVAVLRGLYGPTAALPDLVAQLYGVLQRLMAQHAALRELMQRLDTHFDTLPSSPVFNPRTGLNLSVLADLVPFDKRTWAALTPAARRRLQQSDPLAAALQLPRLPPGFTAAPGVAQSRALVPLVFHIMTYRQGSGYGPPGWDRSAEYLARMMPIVNAMAFRSNFQFFINEVRFEPITNPYLLKADRSSWMACASRGNFFYRDCASVLQGAKDFPRSINIFVVGDRLDASYAGYGWVPSSSTDLTYGHLALLWSVLDPAQWNSQAGWEYASKVLWHEIMHHLGLYHTFGRSNSGLGCSGDDGVVDTPTVAGPVYSQVSFAATSRDYCLDVFSGTMANSWDNVMQAWRTRLGIPSLDSTHGFDSCPSLPGVDELGNYISYTHDVCIAALGHFTPGQVSLMHNMTWLTQRTLYSWGQYFATQAPSAFVPPPSPSPPPAPAPPPSPPPPPSPRLSPSPPPPPPPPPPVPPPPTPCLTTRAGCKCRTAWTYRDQNLTGCANPDGDSVGLWCIIERDGNCASAINGYWDYCAPTASEAVCASDFPRPPQAPRAAPPPPLVPCSGGHVTLSGSVCSRQAWGFGLQNGTELTLRGCANPDSDPEGQWCRLEEGRTTLLGRTWDYCGPGCPLQAAKGAAGGTAIQQAAQACPASQGLPAGCSCRAAWGVVLRMPTSTGRRYTTARHCTAFPELPAGQSACEVEGCQDAALNGRVMVCAAPCSTLAAADGEPASL